MPGMRAHAVELRRRRARGVPVGRRRRGPAPRRRAGRRSWARRRALRSSAVGRLAARPPRAHGARAPVAPRGLARLLGRQGLDRGEHGFPVPGAQRRRAPSTRACASVSGASPARCVVVERARVVVRWRPASATWPQAKRASPRRPAAARSAASRSAASSGLVRARRAMAKSASSLPARGFDERRLLAPRGTCAGSAAARSSARR